jgi:hypothetical protein
MKIKILFFNFFFIFIAIVGFAQTGIGTITPNASAKLDVYSTNKGFLPPRVTLTSATDGSTIASPAEGLLVYNLGSVGLQAGYYYWNGANWATIATTSSAGNGVTSSNLVKLYGEAYSTASGKIGNTNGYSFTVPVSGRYLFDFASSGYANSADFTMTFKVRQGTTDIGTDAQTSASNTVHVEYNGKVEINLQAGTTYNVIVTSTGIRNSSDFDRVYYKQVAGNLPVTGQTVDYVNVQNTGAQTVVTGNSIKFNSVIAGNIPYDASTGNFTLSANKTYRLSGYVTLDASSGGSNELALTWRNAAGTNLGPTAELLNANFASTTGGQGVVDVIYTPTTNTTVSLYVGYASGTAITRPGYTSATIQQIGSSAIINPWTLSGTNTYNTTGNVGIGNNAPTQALDVTGNANISGKITLSDPSGNVTVKGAGFVNAGVAVTLGDIQVQMATGGSRSLQIRTTGTSFTGMVSAFTTYSNSAFTHFSDVTQTINSTYAYIGTTWSFITDGDVAHYYLRDTTNSRFWRITLMVGFGYNNNFISIERLL